MQDDGRLVFGTYTGVTNTITSDQAYNNGQWHHVVATQSGSGMKLYLDGQLVGTNPQTGAEDYPGYWKVGGDITWGSSSNYLAGTIDEVAVYLSELSAERVAAHYAAAAQTPANVAPTAEFTSSANNLVAAFTSTSTDTDGTIAGYSWNFGDATPAGTVANPTHTYAAAGTYTVTLTVTDDDGATGTISHPITVTAAPPANVAPTAEFTSSANNLAAQFTSTSTDGDGTIAGYSWNFGDATPAGTVANPTHTYAAAGTYTVTLTVTDDDGATGTISHPITVTAAPPANVAPTAEFTSSANNLAAPVHVDVDGH